jgi:hypothetical protein
MRELIVSFALALALLAGSALVRIKGLDPLAAERRKTSRFDEDVLRSPGYDALQIAAMQHAPAWSDLFWLQIVQDLGRPVEGEKASYDRLQRWANIAVDLDPRYYTVYWASSIHLISYAHRPDAAEDLLLKGMKQLPEKWEFPFLLGYLNYFLRGDAEAAATWWETAVLVPGSPRFLPSLASRARVQTGDEQAAVELLETLLETLPEGPQREDAELRLKALRSEPILRRYDDACKKFLAERGRRPVDGAELHRENYVEVAPFDLYDEPITIDENCRARTKLIPFREDEAKKYLGSQRDPNKKNEAPAEIR